ncbi:hypothetical protein GCM10009846_01740 [Agrococcus versicolor]|uniref:Outer membrane channel protein CpnT-like N-terminal domain-containing protein n=1 Tax=Agrococcus versicolor TaxID=501482 RepID=A0ABP5MDY3_9MICO
MALTIPGELAWVLDLLGFEWPQLDEDAIHQAAHIMRQFEEDLNSAIDAADANVQEAYASVTGSFARAHADAWDEERSGSMRQLSDLVGPAATGVDLFADAIVALKLKVIAELVITAAQIAVAIASAFVTFGAGAAVQAAILVARKKALDILADIMIDAAVGQVLEMVMDPLIQVAEPLIDATMDSPVVQGAVGEAEALILDLNALDRASTGMAQTSDDVDSLGEDFVSQIMALDFSTA